MNNRVERDPRTVPVASAADAPAVDSGVSNTSGGAAAGAIAGTVVAGPVGTVIGAALGAIAGGIASSSGSEAIDSLHEDAYWREHFVNRSYVESGSSFDDYGPAFGYGVNAYTQYAGCSFASIETELSHGWTAARGDSTLGWDRARNATRDAWDRVSDADGGAVAGLHDAFNSQLAGGKLVEVTQPAPEPK